jgi:hypothetical protein
MQVRKLINAPVEIVWEMLIDTRQWPFWGPSVSAVECPQQYISAGIRGRVKTSVGIWLPFAITLFEPPTCWRWEVAGLPATGHRLINLGPESCEAIFELPLAAFPYALVCRLALGKIARLAEEKSVN